MKIRLSTVLTWLVLSLAIAAEAQPPEELDGLKAELQALNRTVRELVQLQKSAMEYRHLELVLRRVELGNRELAPLNQEVQQARRQRDAYGRQVEQSQTRLKTLEEELRASDLPEEQIRAKMDKAEERLATLEDRQWSQEQKVLDLENDLERAREHLDGWTDYVDQLLFARGE